MRVRWKQLGESLMSSYRRLFLTLLFVGVVFPYALLAVFTYQRAYERQTQAAMDHRMALAELAASRQADAFRQSIDTVTGWAEEIEQASRSAQLSQTLVEVIEQTGLVAFVHQAFIVTPAGDIRAQLHPEDVSVQERPWFSLLQSESVPFVSNVFGKGGDTDPHMLAIVVPYGSDRFVLEYRAPLSFGTAATIDVGEGGFVYFVDREGVIVSHPRYVDEGPLVTFDDVTVVAHVREGESGVERYYHPTERADRVAAYKPVEGYGYGVVVEQEAVFAFADRDEYLRQIAFGFFTGLMVQVGLASAIVATVATVLRKRSEESAMLESIGDGLIVVNRKGEVVRMNKHAEQIVGRSRRELIGRVFTEIVPIAGKENETVGEKRPLSVALRTGERVVTYPSVQPLSYVRPDNTVVPVAVTVTPVRHGHELLGAVMIVRDVTQEQLVEKTKNEFIWVASHQLRTPLTAVNWYAEMLTKEQEEPSPERRQKYTAVIQQESRRMTHLVNALLNVSRLEMGTMRNEPEPLDAATVLRAAIDDQRWQIQEKGITMQENYRTNVTMHVDPKLIRMILDNVISNAVKYTPEHGHIRIDMLLLSDERSIEFIVEDNGYGIPKNQHGKIFTKLFRADNVQGRVPEGTGLGLYIVKNVVDFLGGRVWFESGDGEGTRFHIVLPIVI